MQRWFRGGGAERAGAGAGANANASATSASAEVQWCRMRCNDKSAAVES